MTRTSSRASALLAATLSGGLILAGGVPAGAVVAPSTAPAPSAVTAGAGPRTVLDAGNVYVNALLVEGEPALGLGWSAEASPSAISARYAPDDVVVSIPRPVELAVPEDPSWAPLGAAGAPVWVTSQDFPAIEFTGTAVVPRLNNHALPRDQVASNGVSWEITDVRGPGLVTVGGPVPVPENPVAQTWYAGYGLHKEVTYTPTRASSTSPPANQGWMFSHLGLHCVDLRVSVTGTDGHVRVSPVATVRVAMGNVPDAATAECGAPVDPDQPVLPPEDPDEPDPDDPDPEDLTDPRNNVVLPAEHSDLSLRPGDGELRLMVRENHGNVLKWYEPATLVVHVPDSARLTVPEPTSSSDSTFLAPAGSTIYRLPKVPKDGLSWLGLSAETLNAPDYERLPALRLESVTGPDGGPAPGHFFFGADEDYVRSGAAPYLSTRQGLPQAHPMLAPSLAHKHLSWDFTAPGTYCVRISSTATRTDGRAVDDDTVLTFVVGGETHDATSAPTCLQRQAERGPSHAYAPADGTPGETVRMAEPVSGRRVGFAALTPRAGAGGDDLRLDVVLGNRSSHGVRHDLADVVIATGDEIGAQHVQWLREDWRDAEEEYVRGYRLLPQNRVHNDLRLDLGHLDRDAWAGDLTWTLDGVTGPGDFLVLDYWQALVPGHQGALLSTVPGYESTSATLRPGSASLLSWLFTEAGRYCLTTTLGGTTAAGAHVATTTTLTVAAGVDPAGVEPCPAGGEPGPSPTPTPSGSPSPSPEPTPSPSPTPGPTPGTPGGEWPVTDRTVLARGHVDVMVRVTPGSLEAVVRDDGVIPAADHDPGEVTFSVPAGTRVTVPDDELYSFLGAPGDRVWMLPETQDPALVWPGWSVELPAGMAGARVRWSLDGVRGPGRFVLFDSGGDWGAPRVLLGAGRDAITYREHAHGAWAFSAAGVYCLDVTHTALGQDGAEVAGASDTSTLLFAVGVDPRRTDEQHCGLTAAEFGAGPGGQPGPSPTSTPTPSPTPASSPSPTPSRSSSPSSRPTTPGAGGPQDSPGGGDASPPAGGTGPAPGEGGGPGVAPGGGPLASTGFGAGVVTLLAVLLAGAGAALLVWRRRLAGLGRTDRLPTPS